MIYGDYIIADVFNLYAKRNGKVVIEEEDLSDVGLTLTTSTNEVRAGQYNKIICILRGDKTIEIKANTPKFNLQNLALSLGQDIITGKQQGISHLQKTSVGDSLEVTLKRKPKNEDDIVIKKNGEKLTKTTDYTYTDGKIKFVQSGKVKSGDNVVISPFTFETSEKAQRIMIDSTTFPDGCELWLTTYAQNKNDRTEGELQFKFNNAVPTGELDFSTKSERGACSTPLNFKIISDDNDMMGEVIFIPVDQLEANSVVKSTVGK